MLLKKFPIFCINLDHAEDRWKRVKDNPLNKEVIRFSATDGKYLTDGDLPFLWEKIDREYRFYGENSALFNLQFKPGTVGCALSHYRIWKFAVKHNLDFFCIIEDDVEVIKKIENIECPDDFDIVYISDRIKPNDKNQAIDGIGTDGYILSLNGAKKLIKICEDLFGPIDYRIQSHIRGFIQESVQNKDCLMFHSFKNKNIVLEGYKTPENYVLHKSDISYVDKKYEEDVDNTIVQCFKTKKNVVFIPFNSEVNIVFDKRPNFITIVMCFSSEKPVPKFPYLVDYFCSFQSECKGDLMHNQIKILDEVIKDYNFVAMYDDDIKIKVSDIEKIFKIAEEKKIDLFAPSLSEDSYHTYNFTLNKGSGIRKADWVEIMMPHFSKKFIDQFKVHVNNLSKYDLKTSYGYDISLFPLILKEINGSCAIIDDVISEHKREITSDKKIFSNGLTALQEMRIVENYVQQYDNNNQLKLQSKSQKDTYQFNNMKIKICVNSTKNYSKKTLPIIIPSLINSGIDPEDIFVFEGGHNQRSVIKKDTHTLIQTDNNTIDMTGLIDIVENELESDYWFYIHDTCKVGSKFKQLLYNIPDSLPDKIALFTHPSMNIGSYKYSCLMKYKDKLLKVKNQDYSEKKLKKLKEWSIYCEDLILHKPHQTGMGMIGIHSDTIEFYNPDLIDKKIIQEQSWYGGVNRIIEYYPQLDLYKSKANYHRTIKPKIEL